MVPNSISGVPDAQSAASQQIPSVEENASSAYASVSLCLIGARRLLDTANAHPVSVPRILELNVS